MQGFGGEAMGSNGTKIDLCKCLKIWYNICKKKKDLNFLFGLRSANGISNLVGNFFNGGGVKNLKSKIFSKFWFKLSLF